MGITIHYRGRLHAPEVLDRICHELVEIAQLMEWEYHLIEDDLRQPRTARLEQMDKGVNIKGHLALRGVIITVHEQCERVSFLFDAEGRLREIVERIFAGEDDPVELPSVHVKTQFAPPEAHVSIIKLLRYIGGKFFSYFEVDDEGGYWETSDFELLKQKQSFLDQKITEVISTTHAWSDELTHTGSAEELADKIEKIIRDRFKQIE
jgi:hypothetical protein